MKLSIPESKLNSKKGVGGEERKEQMREKGRKLDGEVFWGRRG